MSTGDVLVIVRELETTSSAMKTIGSTQEG